MDRSEQVKVYRNDADTTIAGVGALDLYNEEFGLALKEASASAESVVVDLRSATYIDTAILASLAVAGHRLAVRGKRLSVRVAEGTHPLRTLRMVGISEIVDLVLEDTQRVE